MGAAAIARIAVAADAAVAPAAAAPALARPAGFGCVWPIDNLPEQPGVSRYYDDHTEHVFRLKVYVNEPSAGDGISIGVGSTGPRKVGVCKIVLPNLESLRRRIAWREADAQDAHGSVFRAIDIREAGSGGTMFTEWLVLKPKTSAVAGETTIEFVVNSGYSDNAQ
jgi:hypothetical protein